MTSSILKHRCDFVKVKNCFAPARFAAQALRPLAHDERRSKEAAAVEAAIEYLRVEVVDINNFITQQVRSLRRVPHRHQNWIQLSWAIWNRYATVLRNLCELEDVSKIAEFDKLRQELKASDPDQNKVMETVEDLFLSNGYLFDISFGKFWEADRIENRMPKSHPYLTGRIPRLSITKVVEDKIEERDIEGARASSRVVILGDAVIPECLVDSGYASAYHFTVRGGKLISGSKFKMEDVLKFYHELRLRIYETGELPLDILPGNDKVRAALRDFFIRAWPASEFSPYASKASENEFVYKFFPAFKQWIIDHETCHQVLNALAVVDAEKVEIYTYLQDLTDPRFCWIRIYGIVSRLAHGEALADKHDLAQDFMLRRVVPEMLNRTGPDGLKASGISESEVKAAITAVSKGDLLPVMTLLSRLPEDFFVAEFKQAFAKLKQESDRKSVAPPVVSRPSLPPKVPVSAPDERSPLELLRAASYSDLQFAFNINLIEAMNAAGALVAGVKPLEEVRKQMAISETAFREGLIRLRDRIKPRSTRSRPAPALGAVSKETISKINESI